MKDPIGMNTLGHAHLAIWSDIDPHQLTDYLHWLTREHVQERVGVDGFLSGRVFRCDANGRSRFFITYALADTGVLAGPSYLARLNAPTPWSQRIMPILQNFARGGGPVVARAGSGWGGAVAPVRLSLAACGLDRAEARQALVDRLVALDAVAQVWLMAVDAGATGVQTREKSMRRSDEGVFDGVLVIEGLHEPALLAALDVLRRDTPGIDTDGQDVLTACFQFVNAAC